MHIHAFIWLKLSEWWQFMRGCVRARRHINLICFSQVIISKQKHTLCHIYKRNSSECRRRQPHNKNILSVALNNFRNPNFHKYTHTHVFAHFSCGIRLRDATIITAGSFAFYWGAQVRENSGNMSSEQWVLYVNVLACRRQGVWTKNSYFWDVTEVLCFRFRLTIENGFGQLDKSTAQWNSARRRKSHLESSLCFAETSPRRWLSCWISWNCFDDFPYRALSTEQSILCIFVRISLLACLKQNELKHTHTHTHNHT